jgi:hypothetical protein
MLSQMLRDDPARSPAWREDYVSQLVHQGRRPRRSNRRLDDELIHRYRVFLERYQTREQEVRDRLYLWDKPLWYAQAYWERRRDWGARLEAYLLTGADDEYIAEELTMDPRTVAYYEGLFFNVRDRLHARPYIVNVILGTAHERQNELVDGVIDVDIENRFLKLCAYSGGPLVLDMMQCGLADGPMPTDSVAAVDWLNQAYRVSVQQKANTAAKFLPINKFNVLQLLELQQRFLLADAETAAGGLSSGPVQNIVQFLDAIKLGVGGAAYKALPAPSLQQFERSAVEPRADEQYALAQDQVSESLQNQFELAEQHNVIQTAAADAAADATAAP